MTMSAATALQDLDQLGTMRGPGARHLRLVAPDQTARPVPRPAPMRVTRRGRLAITCTVTLLLVLAVGGLAGAVIPGGEAEMVTVLPGQTLSHIAAAELPDLPLDRAIVELQLANSLSSSQVQAGQTLVIPEP